MRSLRVRITVLATLVLAVVLAVAAVVIVALVDRQLRNELADQNQQTLNELAEAIERGQDPSRLRLPLGADGTEFVISTSDGAYVQSTLTVVVTEGIDPTLGAGGGLIVGGFPLPDDEFFPDAILDIASWDETVQLATGPTGQGYEIVALSPTEVVARNVNQVRSVLWVVIPILAAVFATLIWFLAGRMLRPVGQMTELANTIRTETLHERLVEPGTNDEIDRLAVTLNSMLDRLDAGARQQRQFVSDASHELRGPLTVMIGEAELAAKNDDRLPSANQAVLQHGRRMSVLIKDLLDLAIHGEARHRPGEVDIDDLLRTEARQQPIPIGTRGVSPAKIIGDEGAIGRLFRNLLDNAAAYCDQRVEVGCSIDRSGRTTLIWVDDDGPGIAAAERDTVFERFSRLDPSRDRTTGGTGLGLAIAKAIVDAHRGSIAIERSPLGGARIRVELPVGAVIPA